MDFDAVSIVATGTQVTTGASSASVAIPNNSVGNRARFVRLQSTGNCYVKLGPSGVTATVNDVLLSPNEALILAVMGNTNLAYLQETAAAKLNISPIEY